MVIHLVKKSPPYVESKGSLQCPKEPDTSPQNMNTLSAYSSRHQIA
jgi:hypothetical protein